GTVEYNCFKITQLSDSLIKSYTEPRYSDVLDHIHSVPGQHLSTHLSIGMEKTERRLAAPLAPNLDLSLGTQRALHPVKDNFFVLFLFKNVTQEVKVEFADIFPCLCYEKDIGDAAWATLRLSTKNCQGLFEENETFWENLWKRSTLNVTLVGDILLWNFSSPCNITANVTLCLWSGRESRCHDIPHFQQPLRVNVSKSLKLICKNKKYLNWMDGSNNFLKITCNSSNSYTMTFFCIVWHCFFLSLDETLFFFFTQVTSENRVIRKCLYKSKCEHLYHCFPVFFPFYIHFLAADRERESLYFALLFVLAVLGMVVIVFKSSLVKAHSDLLNQKVLIVYSRDSEPFETLVGTFASLLLDSGLSVTVDLWRRNELSAQGPLLWFHSQRSEILKEGGKIVVLLSEGAAAKSRDWFESGKGSMPQEDPHDSFMASLNCILPDFLQGEAVGRYVVGYFGDLFDQGSIPEMFRGLPAFNFPSQLHKFLAEVAGSCCGKTKRSAFQKNANINIKLQALVKNCQAWHLLVPFTV
uniref:Interleukin 17 receptor C n=1 Tax=Latimeria chalumnae TaxID=7897 RepID=H2ZU29_LATCH